MRYLVNISFDGSSFYGSQKQKDKRTVIGEIEKVLSKILNSDTKVVGCSRLDKGVHANEFYFHFDANRLINIQSLSKMLPEDITVNNMELVSEEVHARYSVKSKEYKYVINTGLFDVFKRNYLYNYSKEIDVNLLKKASKYFIGLKDFRTFTSDNEKENTTRNIEYIKIDKEDNLVTIYIKGDGFLRYMVRNIVGFLLDINENKYSLDDIDNIINSKDRTKIGKAAPSSGLYLNRVFYK